MAKPDIVAIGGSTGALEVVRQFVARVESPLAASVFVVIHTSPDTPTVLPEIFSRSSGMPAAHPNDGDPIERGRIYVAPPDHHLLLSPTGIALTRGPRENRFRPSIDPLFRTAAHSFGERVIGIILSGGQNDGTAGLWSIEHAGGIAIVQDPQEAIVSSMCESAIWEIGWRACWYSRGALGRHGEKTTRSA